MAQTLLSQVIFPVYQRHIREFLYQKLLVDELIQTTNFRVRLFNMNHRHIFRLIIASNGKGLQLSVNVHARHADIQIQALFQDLMDSLHFIIQMLLYLITLALSPTVQESPYIIPV